MGLLLSAGHASGQARETFATFTPSGETATAFNFAGNPGGTITMTRAACTATVNNRFFGIGTPTGANFPGAWFTPTPPLTSQNWLAAVVDRIGGTGGCIVSTPAQTWTITFNAPVENPRFHFANLDNGRPAFVLGAGNTMTLLSGNPRLTTSGLTIDAPGTYALNNGWVEANQNGCQAADGTNPTGACGSVQANGTYTSITLQWYERNDLNNQGDGFGLTMSLAQPSLVIRKRTINGTGTFDYALSNASVTTESLTTTAQNTFVAGPTRFIATAASDVTVTETVPVGWSVSGSCVDTVSGATVATIAANGAVTIPASAIIPLGSYRCDYTNTRNIADLSLTKTNTPASGASDLGSDSVVRGTTSTYEILVSNAGPLAVANAVLKDPNPSPNLTGCVLGPAPSCESRGSGTATCPAEGAGAGQLSVANLQNGGVLIPSMSAGSLLAFKLTCTVQ